MEDDPLGEHVKTVYAHFALAVYLSQVLEHGLANATLVFDLVPRAASVASPETWPTKVDSFFDEQFRQTLGRMIQNLKKVVTVPSTLEDALARALQKRNWLTHNYFHERAEQFMSTTGRESMIAELEGAQVLFREADKALDRVVKPAQERYGYTEEIIKAREEKMLKEARNDL